MRRLATLAILPIAATLMGQAAPSAPPAAPKSTFVTPGGVVEAAPAGDWREIPATDLLVFDLAGDRRVVMQLAPTFAPVHVANLRALAKGGWWDGAKIYRVQDNYVVQWGNNESERSLPAGVVAKPPAEYHRAYRGLRITPTGSPDAYAPAAGFVDGWPMAYDAKRGTANLAHCYGMVGVGRDMAPDTGTGGELYAVIGHAPRHLDRNIALVGRIVSGFEAMTTLPRGTEALGFYKERSSDVPIVRARLAADIPAAERPRFEYLSGASFAAYLNARKNRRDDFFIRPAGGVDVCNVNPPVRAVAAR
ncbi:peptidylprolyl isomerase [Sphingomonas sp. LY29]|uniref:peptidylprolyl isomerase n=1 Tax=Sphingomonas sp. LY29 TaxID=3095341 RepID=UPI002D766973|nr:peptidylprolyl isomerase [Sphingomonas sp. LY29]WRP25095.1 peptidylprolyl isomerase [Sphingomonas sp. LY29]